MSAPGEQGDVARRGWQQFPFRGQFQVAQQGEQRSAQAGVFVHQFGGFPGGVQPLVPVVDRRRVTVSPGLLQSGQQGQLAAA